MGDAPAQQQLGFSRILSTLGVFCFSSSYGSLVSSIGTVRSGGLRRL